MAAAAADAATISGPAGPAGEGEMNETATAGIPEDVLVACEIAGADAAPVGDQVIITGCGHLKYGRVGESPTRWYRYVWRDGRWVKVARTLRQAVGPVRPGEVLVDVVERRPISAGCLVTAKGFVQLFVREASPNTIYVYLPDGQILIRPNPRK
jgi:hypothetical protein